MAVFTGISTTFSFGSVSADSQASDRVQDSTPVSDDSPAQGSFLPTLASAISSLIQQSLAVNPTQADGVGQTCGEVQTTDAGTSAVPDAQPVGVRSAVDLEANEVSFLMREGSQGILVPITSMDDSRQRVLFSSTMEEASFHGGPVASAGERFPIPMQTARMDENIHASQEMQSASTTLTVGIHSDKREESEAVQLLDGRLHSVQPLAELSDVLDTSVLSLPRERDGKPQIQDERSHTASPSSKPATVLGNPVSPSLREGDEKPEASGERPQATSPSARPPGVLGTPTSSLDYEDEGKAKFSGAQIDTVSSSSKLWDLVDVPDLPAIREGIQSPQVSGEPLRAILSRPRLIDVLAPSKLPSGQIETGIGRILRVFLASRSLGVSSTLEKSIPQPQDGASGTALSEPALSRVAERPAPTSDGMVSTTSVNNQVAQQNLRHLFTATLATISSSAILGNGERAFLFQMGKEGKSGVERDYLPEAPRGIGATMPVQTSEASESGSVAEPQPMPGGDHAAVALADKPGVQVKETLPRSAGDVTVSDTSVDEANSAKERVMPPTAGSEPNARSYGSWGSSETEVGKQPSLCPGENVVSIENTKAGEARSRGRNEKPSGDPGVAAVESEPASVTSDAIAADNALRTSDARTVESVLARGHLQQSAQPPNPPATVGTKPTGFTSQELGFDVRTISSLVTENLTNGISNESLQRLRDGVSELKLQLKPGSLGEMTLKVRLDDEKVVAQIHVTQPEVKLALEATMSQLRDALASRGMEVQRIEVFAAGDAPTRESRGQQEARQRLSARRRGTDVAEERYKGARSMGYNTIEIVM